MVVKMSECPGAFARYAPHARQEPKPNRDGQEMGSELAGWGIPLFATGISTWKGLRASAAMRSTATTHRVLAAGVRPLARTRIDRRAERDLAYLRPLGLSRLTRVLVGQPDQKLSPHRRLADRHVAQRNVAAQLGGVPRRGQVADRIVASHPASCAAPDRPSCTGRAPSRGRCPAPRTEYRPGCGADGRGDDHELVRFARLQHRVP